MTASLSASAVLYGLLVGGGCLVAAVRGRPRGGLLTASLMVLELVMVLQAVLDVADVLTHAAPASVVTHGAYVLVSVVALPAVAGSVGLDDSRWANAALAVACLVLAVISIRMRQTVGHRG